MGAAPREFPPGAENEGGGVGVRATAVGDEAEVGAERVIVAIFAAGCIRAKVIDEINQVVIDEETIATRAGLVGDVRAVDPKELALGKVNRPRLIDRAAVRGI